MLSQILFGLQIPRPRDLGLGLQSRFRACTKLKSSGEGKCTIVGLPNEQESEWNQLHHHPVYLHPHPSTTILTLRLLKSSRFRKSNEGNCPPHRKIRPDRVRADSWKPSVLVLDCALLYFFYVRDSLRHLQVPGRRSQLRKTCTIAFTCSSLEKISTIMWVLVVSLR